ncbi:methyltransferase family protein [Mumia flava]|uniref:Methyltransferase family protein n=1 Tax=Mumia flava TaxID=1348852 RepID=A0A2M9BE29_9ACTN|nr:class I SAM-dependent methyltransferase [Mumia flava]PJJ56205.1 methyltransferase family protein [Mumia flava]
MTALRTSMDEAGGRRSRSVVDHAYAGASAEVVTDHGTSLRLPVGRWCGDADEGDHRLFVDRCSGFTLDIGCGPGRLAGALTRRKVPALGIDISAEAVRLARGRGAPALRLDVFDRVPGVGTWHHALLADGNIGIGGDPVRLLRRIGALVRAGGTVLAEVEPAGVGLSVQRLRVRVGERTSEPFAWARLGLDALAGVVAAAGMRVLRLHEHGGRYVVELERAESEREGP